MSHVQRFFIYELILGRLKCSNDLSYLTSMFLENFVFVNYIILDYDEICEEDEKKSLRFDKSFKWR